MLRSRDKNYYTPDSCPGDIAILGGSFNPIHNGHISMAVTAHEQYGLNIILMPNSTTYYKENAYFAPNNHRIEMLRLVADRYDYMYYSDMEIVRGGITHTIDTIRELRNEDEGREIYFIIGGDSLEWIDKWVEADELLSIIHVLTAVRGSTDIVRTRELIAGITSVYSKSRIDILNMDNIDISSSSIRENIASNISITGLVPEYIENYIYTNKLYQ